MDLESVRRAYRRYAPIYDIVFGPVMAYGRTRTVRAVNQLGPKRILEVGVGTGLSLPHYRNDIHITGIDVSGDMLAVARERVKQKRLDNVDQLLEMDAETLDFPDGEFDAVVAMYVMSVVPNPSRCLAEMRRVCKPGGDIVICNHFYAESDSGKPIVQLLTPMARWLGWRPDFKLDSILSEDSELTIISNQSVPPLGLFNVLQCRNGLAAA